MHKTLGIAIALYYMLNLVLYIANQFYQFMYTWHIELLRVSAEFCTFCQGHIVIYKSRDISQDYHKNKFFANVSPYLSVIVSRQ